ncbi:MAG TPA: GspE/PulE family protein [Gemmatimonadaceae bacterium]|nr:GspE/PulE family protein [Gemmatimonadaceae bacterium]
MPAFEPIDLDRVGALTTQLTAEYLEHHALLPLGLRELSVIVGTWRDEGDLDPQALDDLRLIFDRDLEFVRRSENDLLPIIRRVYGIDPHTAQEMIAGLAPDLSPAAAGEIPLDDLVHLANEAPVVKLVNLLVLEALEARASDVHLEAYAHALRVRYRIDGVLQEAPSPPAHLTAAIISRLKIMAELDIAERRLPQDGRIRLQLQDRHVDVRVATLPTLLGESVVLRLLDKEHGRIALSDLGMAPDTLAQFSQVISRPHGIVLATGPTGSGKTTTLYAAVDLIRTGREKILTVEDPVEYQLTGVPQVAVNDKIGVTFATALRALLRQDPDVMLVGEIRDSETAEIATQAALTGHLVLSTLHTNDAPSALTRLLELRVAPYLVASTVEGVLAQRLVRKVCDACRQEAPVHAGEAEVIEANGYHAERLWRGAGCGECRGTGYRGRHGIYELLIVNDDVRAELQRGGGASALRAVMSGRMRTIRQDGIRLVTEGITTLDEVLRVTMA